MEWIWNIVDSALIYSILQLIPYALVVLLPLWYIYLTWNFDYWSKQGVPGDKPRPIIGTFRPLWKISLEKQDVYCTEKHGLTFGVFFGQKPALLSGDPELIKQVMVKDFPSFPNRTVFDGIEKDKFLGKMLSVLKGEEWRMVRNTLTPSYTTGKLKQMVCLIEECVHSMNKSLETNAESGEPAEFVQKFSVLTLDVIASCAFGMKIDSVQNPDSEFVKTARKVMRGNPIVIYFLILFASVLKYIPFFKQLMPNPMMYFKDVANKAIDMRLQNMQTARKDFLQIMLEAEKVENNDVMLENDDETTEQPEKVPPLSKKTLSRDVIVAQTALFILAGHETTANSLSFAVYELALNPEIQNKLIQEIDEAMSECKGNLTYEVVAGMQYLEMFVSETLRMYPPAVRTDRVCDVEEYDLKGIKIKKGMQFVAAIYSMHHNPEFFPDPEKFVPERFTPENKAKRNPFTYLPFGIGPRNCIAMRFALLEIKLVLVHLLSQYQVSTCKETEIPVQTRGIGLLQPTSVKLKIQKRIDQPHFEDITS